MTETTTQADPIDLATYITLEPGAAQIEADLCAELKAYCDQHKLEHLSADDLRSKLLNKDELTDDDEAHVDWLGDFINRWEAWERASQLMGRLANKYPDAGFDLVTRDSISEQDNPLCPLYVVSFTHREVCIVDPLTVGFGACDPQAAYGIEREDAEAIREFNNVIAG